MFEKSFLENIIVNAPIGIITTDFDLNMTFLNNMARWVHFINTDATPIKFTDITFNPDEIHTHINKLTTEAEQRVSFSYHPESHQETFISCISTLLRDDFYKPIGILFMCQDMTQQKILEEKVQEYTAYLESMIEIKTKELELSEYKLHSILQRIPDVVYSYSPEEGFTFISPSVEKVTGYTAEEIKNDRNLFTSLIQDIDKQEIGKVIGGKGGIPQPDSQGRRDVAPTEFLWEYKLNHKNGNVIYIRDHARTVLDENGKLFRVDGIMVDITDQKILQDKLKEYSENLENLVEERTLELKESETRYRTLFDNASDGMILMSADSQIILEANSTFQKISGFKVHELLKKRLWFFIPSEQVQEIQKNGRMLQNTDEIRTLVIPFRKKNGDVIKAEFTCRNLKIKNQKVVLSIVRDITEKEKLESEKRYLASIVENSKDAIIGVNLHCIIQSWNKGAIKLYKYTVQEIINQSLNLLFPLDKQKELDSLIKRISNGEEITNYQSKNITKDGETIDVELSLSTIKDSSDNIIGASVIIKDITEQKKLEQQLIQAQKMESIATLASGVAHDFNNILGGILGYASLLKAIFNADSDTFHIADIIEISAQRGADLAKQLLSIGRGTKFTKSIFSVNEIINEVIRLLERSINKNINIEKELNKDLYLIEGDPTQIQQVILNICLNARDAMPEGGTLTLKSKNIFLNEHFCRSRPLLKSNDYILIEISDTGIGINERIKSKIFEPFFTTKPDGKGTGLGLSVAYGIVVDHKGHIEFESKLNSGTKFSIFFYACKEIKKALLNEIKLPIPEGSEKILIVDDEETVRDLASTILGKLGYKTIKAENGEKAIQLFKSSKDKIDLILLDLIMPKLDGRNTYFKLKEINPNFKCVLSSGYSEEYIARDILQAGANGFVQKPYRLEELAIVIRNILDS